MDNGLQARVERLEYLVGWHRFWISLALTMGGGAGAIVAVTMFYMKMRGR